MEFLRRCQIYQLRQPHYLTVSTVIIITFTTKVTLNQFSHFPPECIYLVCVDIGEKNNGNFLTQNYVMMRVFTVQ